MTDAKLGPQAGYIDVSKLLIVSHETNDSIDILGNFIKINIDENIFTPYLSGHIDIVDSYGLIYPTASENTENKFFQIRGEEYLHIEYNDFNTFDDDGAIKKETYFIYAIEEIDKLSGNKETALQYRLYFTSAQKIFSDTKRISKAYRNMTISEMVNAIYEEYYLNLTNDLTPKQDKLGNILSIHNKEIEIEPTNAKFTIVIPSMTPEEAISFLGRRAYSEKNSSSFFVFFEGRDKFYFCTTEYLIEKNRLNLIEEANRFVYADGPNDNSPAGQKRAMQIIQDGTYPKFNSVEAIKSQAYSARISEIDLSHRDIAHYYYHYKDNYLGYNNVDERPTLPNSSKFISETTGDVNHIDEGYVFKDYKNIGEAYTRPANQDREYPYYKETLSTKPVFNYHFGRNAMSGMIKGRDALKVGDLINVEIPQYTVLSMSEHVGEDKYFGGSQMMIGIGHVIAGNEWAQTISFTKALRGGGLETNKPGTSQPPSEDGRTTADDLTPKPQIKSETS